MTMKRIVLLASLASGSLALGVPVELERLNGGGVWMLPGNEKGTLMREGMIVGCAVKLPERTDKEKEIGGEWLGVISVDAYGTVDGKPAEVLVEVLEPKTGDVFASGVARVQGRAVKAAWGVIASSEQGGSAVKMFDGDPETDWHSRYGDQQPEPPHWVGLEFGVPQKISGVKYTPRQGGFTNGVAKKYRVEVRKPGGGWEVVARGESGEEVAKDRKPVEVKFGRELEVEAYRFVIESDWSGGGFGTGGELEATGFIVPKEREKPVAAASRVWLELPKPVMKLLEGKEFAMRVRSKGDGGVVVGVPRFCRVHEAPTGDLFGRSNGGLGPDKLGAGLFGFDALTEHGQTVLTLMEVRSGSPAAKAKLKKGDVVVAVNGRPLPVNDLNPGWRWFEESHEAVLGRETEAALLRGDRRVELSLLKEGKVEKRVLELPRVRAFGTMDPATDAEAAMLLKDLIRFLEKSQKEDGSWSGDIIRTTFSSLALMATGEKKYRSQVKKAVEWSLEKYPKPEDYGNLGFWSGAYAGILYSEWYLATGDKRVLQPLEALRNWAVAGKHESIWGVPALGHGPSGLPYENKALVAPACHLLVYEALAMRCGMESGIWEMLMPYMEMAWSDPREGGHGSLGYNRSYKDTEEFWSRSGLFAMAAHLRGEREDMKDAMTGFMRKNHPWIRNSHAYGEPGGAWGLLGLNLAEPEAYREVIREYGWWFGLAWEPGYGLRFTTPHMGAPYMGEDDLINATYALVLQAPKANLHLTGLKAGSLSK